MCALGVLKPILHKTILYSNAVLFHDKIKYLSCIHVADNIVIVPCFLTEKPIPMHNGQ